MKRLQRLRSTQVMRDLVNEVSFSRKNLVQPFFVVEGLHDKEPIHGLDGNYRYPLNQISKAVESLLEKGISNVLIFCVPKDKSDNPSDFSFITKTSHELKSRFGNSLNLMMDTCLCSSTASGHCCIYNTEKRIDSEQTLATLSRYAIAAAEGGTDVIAPSDMQDGRTAAIRKALDEKHFIDTPILSYSTKFASCFYGPFRNAAECAPQFGDRKTYQLDVRSRKDALASSRRCVEEGADMLMVKPAMTSLDLIGPIGEQSGLPVGAYHVSGEFAALAFLAREKMLKLEDGLIEHFNVLRRGGASFVITYGAERAASIGF